MSALDPSTGRLAGGGLGVPARRGPDRAPLAAIARLSAAALGYEILLMGLFSIIQWHQFAYMMISVALLGYGAAGTFVVRKPVGKARLRAELARMLPFDTDIIVLKHRDIISLMSKNPFARRPVRPDIVRFVSVLSQRPRLEPSMPVRFPQTGKWLVRILARDGPFVFGEYRRHMKAIGYLGMVDPLFGVRVTTRNWITIMAIAKTVGAGET